MHGQAPTIRHLEPVFLSVPRRAVWLLLAGIAVGAGLILAGWLASGGWERRFWLAYLVACLFVLSLSLGSLFFVLLQHLTRAGWSVAIRRPAEIYALNVVTVLLLFVPLGWAVSQGKIYPWAVATGSAEIHPGKYTPALHSGGHQESGTFDQGARGPSDRLVGNTAHLYVHQQYDELTRSKSNWLNRSAFLGRVTLYFAIWIVLAGFYFSQSRRQDRGDLGAGPSQRMEWAAGLAALAFGLSLTFAAFDWLMSLDPHWYSTMFGVYFFAGCAVGGLALNLLTQQGLESAGLTTGHVSLEHRRDLGRFLFAFVFFWGYIAFSQYMLLWYANLPETTRWFAIRGASQAASLANSWGYLLIGLLLGHFLIPFAGILSRHVKANRRAMYFWTAWLLVFHYFDLYWLVMPELGPQFRLGLMEIGTLCAVGCTYLLGASVIGTWTSLIPVGDPRIGESLSVSEVY